MKAMSDRGNAVEAEVPRRAAGASTGARAGRRPSALAAVLALCAVALLAAQVRSPRAALKVHALRGTGTIQYDPGAPADSLLGQTGPSVTIGNRFNSANGQPLAPGTVTFLSFYMANHIFGPGVGVFWGPPTGGGGASAILRSFNLTPITNNTFNAFFLPLLVPVPSDFLVGLYLPSGPAGAGQLGMRSVTTNGQGFHAAQISWNGGAGTNYGPITGQNAMLRVAGNMVIPVELLEFEVE